MDVALLNGKTLTKEWLAGGINLHSEKVEKKLSLEMSSCATGPVNRNDKK